MSLCFQSVLLTCASPFRLLSNCRNLLIDPRTRKIIVIENPLLSTRIKEMIARILFDNLQVSVNGRSERRLGLRAVIAEVANANVCAGSVTKLCFGPGPCFDGGRSPERPRRRCRSPRNHRHASE